MIQQFMFFNALAYFQATCRFSYTVWHKRVISAKQNSISNYLKLDGWNYCLVRLLFTVTNGSVLSPS